MKTVGTVSLHRCQQPPPTAIMIIWKLKEEEGEDGKIVWRKEGGGGEQQEERTELGIPTNTTSRAAPMCEIKASADDAKPPRKLSHSNTSTSLCATFAYFAWQHVGLHVSCPFLWQLTREATCCHVLYIKVAQKLIDVCVLPCFRSSVPLFTPCEVPHHPTRKCGRAPRFSHQVCAEPAIVNGQPIPVVSLIF